MPRPILTLVLTSLFGIACDAGEPADPGATSVADGVGSDASTTETAETALTEETTPIAVNEETTAIDETAAAAIEETAAFEETSETEESDAAEAPIEATALPIDEHLADVCPVDPDRLRSSTPVGDALRRVTLDAPQAVCNDGTPAVMYVRRAATAEAASRWVFYLQGGSSCAGYDDCRARWCGEQGIYDAAKMSSRWAPAGIGATGLFGRGPGNALGDGNQVYLYYCSSDTWLGEADDVRVSGDTAEEAMTLQRRGHSILDATLTALSAGVTSDDGSVTMPALADATFVLWTGGSAGSNGATQHLDWVAERVAGARVAGVFDAGFGPRQEDFEPDIGATLEARTQERMASTYVPGNYFLDESCVAHFAASPDELWRCSDSVYLKLNHVTTPFLQRLDLRDALAVENMATIGVSAAELADNHRKALIALQSIQDTAVERDAITVTPGSYGSNCRQHIALMNRFWWGAATVADEAGEDTSFMRAVERWLAGESVVAVDTDPRSTSVCGQTTDDR